MKSSRKPISHLHSFPCVSTPAIRRETKQSHRIGLYDFVMREARVRIGSCANWVIGTPQEGFSLAMRLTAVRLGWIFAPDIVPSVVHCYRVRKTDEARAGDLLSNGKRGRAGAGLAQDGSFGGGSQACRA